MDATLVIALSAIFASLGLTLVLRRRRNRKIKRKYWVRPWIRRRDCSSSHNILHLYKELLTDGDVQEFRSTLRMDPPVYHGLLELLRPALTKKYSNFRRPVSPEARLALTLRYLALGECFRSLSQAFRIGLSTTRIIVRHTCQAIARVLGDEYLRTPNARVQWLQVASEFHQRWDFPHCLGAVDGKHIRITAPSNTGSYYHNYKDFFSIVLLAVVNASYEFIYVDNGSEGKASDGGIWSKCTFNQCLIDDSNPLKIPEAEPIEGLHGNIPYFLVADDAFRLGPHIMKGYPGQLLTKRQQIFNYRLSRARRIVENVFGILTTRFQIFRRAIEVHPECVTDVVMACCILHNYLRRNGGQQYIPNVAVDQELEDGQVVPGIWRQQDNLSGMQRDTQKNPSAFAKSIRQQLSEYFITTRGEIDWQYDDDIL